MGNQRADEFVDYGDPFVPAPSPFAASAELKALHVKAREIVSNDSHLSIAEANVLFKCIDKRQEDRAVWHEMDRRAARDKQRADEVEQEYKDFCTHSWWPNAVIFRMRTGAMFVTQRDHQARDRRDHMTLELTRQRNKDSLTHKVHIEKEELYLHGELAAHGPYAKRLFNTIAISRHTTGNHFAPSETRAALHLPDPLWNVLR